MVSASTFGPAQPFSINHCPACYTGPAPPGPASQSPRARSPEVTRGHGCKAAGPQTPAEEATAKGPHCWPPAAPGAQGCLESFRMSLSHPSRAEGPPGRGG